MKFSKLLQLQYLLERFGPGELLSVVGIYLLHNMMSEAKLYHMRFFHLELSLIQFFLV